MQIPKNQKQVEFEKWAAELEERAEDAETFLQACARPDDVVTMLHGTFIEMPQPKD